MNPSAPLPDSSDVPAPESPAAPLPESGAAPASDAVSESGAGEKRARSVGRSLRRAVTALAIGCACTGIWTLFIGPLVHLSIWLALHLASSPMGQAALGSLALGLAQALICFATLALFSLLFEIAVPVGAAAGLFAGLLPMLVVLLARGPEYLLPLPVLAVRLAMIALGGVAAGFATQFVRSRLGKDTSAPKTPGEP